MEERARRRHVSGALALCLAIGCSDRDRGAVEGVVTLDGKPVGAATVTFRHESSGALTLGKTDPQGLFSVNPTAATDKRGAKVGRHQVMISAVQIDAPSAAANPGLGSLNIATQGQVKVTHLIPKKYAAFETSGLSFEVSPGQNIADFPLTE